MFLIRIANANYVLIQIDKFSDYALRILIALTAYALEKLSTSQIARIYGRSENHLAKIATQLSKGGFVVSESGRGGGLTLAVLVVDISIGAVLRALKKMNPPRSVLVPTPHVRSCPPVVCAARCLRRRKRSLLL